MDLNRFQSILIDILKGEKPVIDPNSHEEKWVYDLIVRMRADFFFPEDPKSYITLLGETDDEISKKGDTRHHSLGEALLRQHEKLGLVASAKDIHNFKILGFDYGYRNLEVDQSGQLNDADCFVLAPGDFYSIFEFTKLLQDKRDGKLGDKKLIIFNKKNYYDEMISSLGIEQDEIDIVETRDEIVPHIEAMGDIAKNKPVFSKVMKIKPNNMALLQTGNNKKVHELDSCIEAQGGFMDVLPFSTTIDKPKDAEEISKTATGNDFEKFQSVRDLILKTGLDKISKTLERRGVDPKNVTIWFDDRALDFAEDFLLTEIFDDCRDKINEYKKQPGVELAKILDVMSLLEFYERIEKAADILLKANEERGISDAISRKAEDIQIYMVAPLVQDNDELEYYTFHAINENELHFEPFNDGGRHTYSEHFLEMVGSNPDSIRNIEFGDEYFNIYSPMGRAVRVAANVLGFSNHEQEYNLDLKNRFEDTANDNKWKIGLSMSHGTKALNGEYKDKYDIISGDLKQYSFRKATEKGDSGLKKYQELLEDSDAYMWLPQHDVDKTDLKYYWRNVYMFFSQVVGNQVFNPHIHGKPFVMVDDETCESNKALTDLYDHFHEIGFLGDKPEHILKKVPNITEAREYLDKELSRRKRPNISRIDFREEGVLEDNLYTTSIYGAAKNENPKVYKPMNSFSSCLAALGGANKNGGGCDGTMRRMNEGAHLARKWFVDNNDELGKMPENHVASIQCEDTYRSEGVWGDRDGQTKNEYTCYCDSIEERMDILGDNDAEVIFPGGAGTIQEISGSILKRLYSNAPKSSQSPLVILNMEINGKRIYDPLINMISDDMKRDLNVHVVDNWVDALIVVMEDRAVRGKEPANIDYNILPRMLLELEEFDIDIHDIERFKKWCNKMQAANNNVGPSGGSSGSSNIPKHQI